MSMRTAARTYNQNHIARKYTPGKRRMSIYWTWSYPWEAQRDLAEMENRFSTMTEVRHVAWPDYETPEWNAAQFLQGIAGTLELFHRSTLSFQRIAGDATGHSVAVFQRIDQAGYKLPIDERILADADTLMVFGLDHMSRARGGCGRNCRHSRMAKAGRYLPLAGAASRCRLQRRFEAAANGISSPPRSARPTPLAVRAVHALADEGAWRSGAQYLWPSPRAREGNERDRAAHRLPRSRRSGASKERPDPQFSSAPAPLRTDGAELQVSSGPGAPADRSRPPAPLHRGRKQGVQLPALDGAERAKSRKHRPGRLHQFHHAFRRHRESRELLEESSPQ